MKISWRLRLTLTIVATVFGAISVTWALNRFFLEKYYINTKLEALKSTYESVEQILSKYYVGEENNQSASVNGPSAVAANYTVAYTEASQADVSVTPTPAPFGPRKDEFGGEFVPGEKPEGEDVPPPYEEPVEITPQTDTENFLSDKDSRNLEAVANRYNLSISILWNYDYSFSTANVNTKERVFFERISGYSGGSNQNKDFNSEVMYTDPEGRYNITKAYDGRTRSTYIELFAQDDTNASFVLIRTNVESMQDSVHIANTFLLYAGILVLIVASGIMLVASGRVVRPIKQLSEIAKRMSALDFTSKYEGRSHDEIGELGESINTLSEKLEETISDLKSVNNRLQSDIEQKIQVDEIRKEFLANVTHELKTPIALISGYAEGLKDCINDDAESRDYYCDVIIDEAGKMNTMVKKLLTLNQIEFGNQIIELKRFDICEVIRSVLNASDVLIKNKGAKLLVNAKGPINVWADEYMVEEVFTNYLTNALNHCENEMIVDVKAETKGKTVRISVFNTGKPIPEEDIDKIWIKFYKVDKARTREYGGSGIGLSIVKAIMEAHNKPYGVINHSNGVEFWFELDSDTKI